jgi:DNA-binding CsgD family transcriptional regulator
MAEMKTTMETLIESETSAYNSMDNPITAERRITILKLRNAGVSLHKIAERLGISVDLVKADITRVTRAIIRENASDIVANQLAITRDMVAALYPGALRGETGSVHEIVNLLAHQAKLLGLYAPQKVEIGMAEEDFATAAAELLGELTRYPDDAKALRPTYTTTVPGGG